MILNRLKQFLYAHKLLLLIVSLFGWIYASISLVNHYNFRTYALDLGMFNHALYSFSRFQSDVFTLDVLNRNINYFADHFSPITILYTPFYFLFGSYTLLIIQILSILAGGLGIFFLTRSHTDKPWLPYLILIHFYVLWGIYHALSFDFHNNVIAAMLLPWFIYAFEKQSRIATWVLFLLLLITKESTAVWLFFVLLGMGVKGKGLYLRRNPVLLSSMIGISLIYFILVLQVILPAINGVNEVGGQITRYDQYGASLFEIALNFLKHPVDLFKQLLFSSGGQCMGTKEEFHMVMLLSGGVLVLFAPYLWFWIIPLYMMKFLSNECAFWGIANHYSIEFVPVLALALFEVCNSFKSNTIAYLLAGATIVMTTSVTYQTMEHSRADVNYTRIRFYDRMHYRNELNSSEINRALHLIPPEAPLSVHAAIAPHLAFRKGLYHFPVINDAEYIALFSSKRGSYPITNELYAAIVDTLRHDSRWNIQYDTNDLLILKRMVR